jgi:hypothetical protein
MKEEVVVEPALADRPATFRRLSWQAVFGGLVVTLAVQLLLTVLAISIGVSTRAGANQPGLGGGSAQTAAIAVIVISIISLFFGGWVSGRLSGLIGSSEGALHGLVTWGAATLLTVWLLGSAAVGVLGGMGKFWSQNLPTGDQMNQISTRAAPQNNNMNASAAGDKANNDLNSIKQEARNIAQKHATTPTGRPAEEQSAKPQEQGTSSQLVSALDRMFSHGENINPNDRNTVVNILVTQDNMSRSDANETVDRWIKAYQQKNPGPNRNEQTTVQSVTQNALAAGWGSFIALVLGLLFAMWGGSMGALAYRRATRLEPVAAK